MHARLDGRTDHRADISADACSEYGDNGRTRNRGEKNYGYDSARDGADDRVTPRMFRGSGRWGRGAKGIGGEVRMLPARIDEK